MQISSLDASLPTPVLQSWHALKAATDVELEPHIPPALFDEALAGVQTDDLDERIGWLIVDRETVVGFATLEMPRMDNPQLAMLDVRIDAGRRRAGLGTELTRVAATAAHDAGKRSMVVEAVDGSAGSAACSALGAAAVLASTASNVRVADIDRSLIERWIARRSERAGGYSLVSWIDACPDGLVETFARLRDAMDTAPKGKLDLTIEWSPQSVRAAERSNLRRGRRNLVVCARHDATGELVGLTDVIVPSGRPTVAYQEDTVVRPDHRNRGLGRWVKAEMLRWLAEEEPQLERIVTWNATENAAMRAINTELGFVPDASWAEWQFNVADLVKRLERVD